MKKNISLLIVFISILNASLHGMEDQENSSQSVYNKIKQTHAKELGNATVVKRTYTPFLYSVRMKDDEGNFFDSQWSYGYANPFSGLLHDADRESADHSDLALKLAATLYLSSNGSVTVYGLCDLIRKSKEEILAIINNKQNDEKNNSEVTKQPTTPQPTEKLKKNSINLSSFLPGLVTGSVATLGILGTFELYNWYFGR